VFQGSAFDVCFWPLPLPVLNCKVHVNSNHKVAAYRDKT